MKLIVKPIVNKPFAAEAQLGNIRKVIKNAGIGEQ